MASIRQPESIAKLVKSSSTTASLPASRINIGGQQYVTTSALTLSTATIGAGGVDVTIQNSKRYYVYAVQSSGSIALIASLSSTGPAGFTLSRLVGHLYSGNASVDYVVALDDIGSEAARISALPNRIINGAMDIWQRATTATITPAAGVVYYTADRYAFVNYFDTGSLTMSRSTDVPTNGLSKYSLSLAVNSAITTTSTDKQAGLYCRLEGANIKDLQNKVVTFSFWIKCSVVGTYSMMISPNLDSVTRVLLKTFTVNQANTWEQKTITGYLDASSGTWATDNTQGLGFTICLKANATRQGAVTDTWITPSGGNIPFSLTGQTFLGDTAGATMLLTQVQLNEGYVPAAFKTVGGDAQAEVARCQRYYNNTATIGTSFPGGGNVVGFVGQAFNSGNVISSYFSFPGPMRATPNLTFYDTANTAGKVSWAPGGGSLANGATAPVASASEKGFFFSAGGLPTSSNGAGYLQYAADAEL
jgi:hypothetical protein